jgi:hypothetical protein
MFIFVQFKKKITQLKIYYIMYWHLCKYFVTKYFSVNYNLERLKKKMFIKFLIMGNLHHD